MDESFFANVGKWGIGGVFRDFKEKVLLQFGKEVDVDLTVHGFKLSYWLFERGFW